jgi:hypothetical protein
MGDSMNKRFWIAFAACYVVAQTLGFLVHGLWLNPTYEALAAIFRPKAEMDAMMGLMFVSSAIALFAFCFIFTKGYEGKGVMEGVRYGVLVALLFGIPSAMDQFWIYPVPMDLAIKWGVTNAIYWVVLGAVVAAIYKPDAKAA